MPGHSLLPISCKNFLSKNTLAYFVIPLAIKEVYRTDAKMSMLMEPIVYKKNWRWTKYLAYFVPLLEMNFLKTDTKLLLEVKLAMDKLSSLFWSFISIKQA